MKPNFALTLSFEGIGLLHRSPSGWTVVGQVPLDEPNLAGALAAMRATAVGLEPGGIRTKVMLPAEQVTVLDAAGPGEEAARAALEAATPHAVADLAIDHVTVDGRARVAAVARGTLEEAEAFAAGHRFHPVSFAAVLPDGGFPGEAFFGETRLARAGAERVERDALPTVPRAPRAAGDEGRPAGASPEVGPDNVAHAAPALATVAAAPEIVGPELAGVPARFAEASPDLATPPDPAEAPLSATGVPEPVFASRSRVPLERVPERETPAPVLVGATRVPPRAPPRATSASRPALAEAAPTAAAASVVAVAAPDPVLAAPAPPRPKRSTLEPTVLVPEPARVRGRPRFLGLVLTAILLLTMLAVGVLASSTQQGVAGLLGLVDEPVIAAAPPLEAPAPEPELAAAPAAPPTHVEVAAAPATPKPEEVASAAAAVAAAIEALPEPEPAPVAAPGTPVSPDEADRIHAATGVWLRAPRLPDLPQGEALAPDLAATADTWRPEGTAPAPLLRVTADAGLVAPPVPPAPRPPPARAPAPPPAPLEEAVTPPAVIALAEAPPLPPPTRSGPPAPVAKADEPPTGTFANAMAEAPSQRPVPRPTNPDLPDSMRVAAAPVGAPLGQPGSVPGGIVADALAQLSAPPASLAFAGTPAEDSQAPAGAVGLGAFEVTRPPSRPDGLAPEAPEAVARFDGPRPGLRPQGLAPEAPAEEPVVTDGAAEPATDPAAIASAVAAAQAATAPPAEAPAPQADVQSALASIVAGAPDPLAGATQRAVAVARVPGTRPRNFDSVVRDQLARTARAAEPAAAPQAASPEEAESSGTEVASAAAVPSGATAQSVAQAATFADVMALREVNLIGVFGQPSDRRALVRMGNGRYMRVGVGDSLDGGQVTAIGDNVLNYTKRGRQVQLVIPGG